MHWYGIIIGISLFIIIGAFHPIVIKGEYYFGKKIWPVFLIAGIICLILSVFIGIVWISAILASLGVTCLWSIKEIYEQEDRVRKGWFPENPKRPLSQAADTTTQYKQTATDEE